MSHRRGFLARLRADSAEAVFFLRTLFYLWPTATVAGVFLAYFLLDKGRLSPTGFWIMAALSVPGGLLFALGTWGLLGSVSRGFVQILFAGGNIAPGPAFSLEESLIARGEYRNAHQALENRLSERRDVVAIQLRLADLNARLIKDPAAAERWYLAARAGQANDQQRWEATNGLVDLYRATGQRGRLMAELARLAESWPSSRAAEEARRDLQALKRGDV